jgi:hypothetical protein
MTEFHEDQEVAASLVRAQTLAVVRKLSKGLGPAERARLAATLLNTVCYSRLELKGDSEWLAEMLREFWQWASDEHRRTLANAVCEQLIAFVRNVDSAQPSYSEREVMTDFIKAAARALRQDMAKAAVTADTLNAISGDKP